MSFEKNKEEIVEQKEGISNLRRANDEKIKETCIKSKIYGKLDFEQFKKMVENIFGDCGEYHYFDKIMQ